MRHIPGIICGTAIAAGMIFTVKALPLELQGSVGLLIGLIVGMAMMGRKALTSKERRGAE